MNGTERASTLLIDQFVTDAEQTHLRELAISYRQRGILEPNKSGPLRYRKKIYGTPYCDDQVKQLCLRITARLKLDGYPVDPYLGWIVSYIEPGGFIKPHIDRHAHYQHTGDRHLRCNILVQGDNESACPVIAGQRLAVGERGLWAFFASEQPHGTAVLRGRKPRIVYQFGFVVPGDFELQSAGSHDEH